MYQAMVIMVGNFPDRDDQPRTCQNTHQLVLSYPPGGHLFFSVRHEKSLLDSGDKKQEVPALKTDEQVPVTAADQLRV